MTTRRLHRVLLACVLSNGLIASVALVAASQPSTITTASAPHAHASVLDAATPPTDVTTSPTTATTPAPLVPAITTSKQVASTTTRKKSSSTTAAVAADDTSGIVSSAAPPDRVAPDAGAYAATFSGSATVDGKAQKVPSTGSIVFAASGGDLRQTSPGTPGGVALTQRFLGNETDLVTLQIKTSNLNKTFTPTSPVAFLRYDSPTGTSWTWAATSTDGKTRLAGTGSIAGSRTVNVSGQDVPTIEINTDIKISGDINGTAQLTTWVSPTYRLPVIQRQQINAKQSAGYGFTAQFVSDITATLTSLSPS